MPPPSPRPLSKSPSSPSLRNGSTTASSQANTKTPQSSPSVMNHPFMKQPDNQAIEPPRAQRNPGPPGVRGSSSPPAWNPTGLNAQFAPGPLVARGGNRAKNSNIDGGGSEGLTPEQQGMIAGAVVGGVVVVGAGVLGRRYYKSHQRKTDPSQLPQTQPGPNIPPLLTTSTSRPFGGHIPLQNR